MKNIDEQLKIIRHGASEIIHEDDLIDKLKSKKKLVIKAGLDPTMPDMHLGHLMSLISLLNLASSFSVSKSYKVSEYAFMHKKNIKTLKYLMLEDILIFNYW